MFDEQIWYPMWSECAEIGIIHVQAAVQSSGPSVFHSSAVIVTAEFGWEKKASSECTYVPPFYYLTQPISAWILR